MSFWTAVSALAGVARLGDLQASHMHQKPLTQEIEWTVGKIPPPEVLRADLVTTPDGNWAIEVSQDRRASNQGR
jgi:hypothetical protein